MTTQHQQWEYDWTACEVHEMLTELKKMGEKGWEVCGCFPSSGLNICFIFKRPKQ